MGGPFSCGPGVGLFPQRRPHFLFGVLDISLPERGAAAKSTAWFKRVCGAREAALLLDSPEKSTECMSLF